MMVYVQFCTDLKLHNFTSLQDQSDSEGRKKRKQAGVTRHAHLSRKAKLNE
jgi:hypothetical protein